MILRPPRSTRTDTLSLHDALPIEASLGVLWKEISRRDDDQDDEDGGKGRRLFARAFSLFNADQVDGYAPEPGPVLPESERLAAAEAFIAALGIDTVYGSSSAYRSEEHTSELQSLMRISYAVFCLKKKKIKQQLHSRQI